MTEHLAGVARAWESLFFVADPHHKHQSRDEDEGKHNDPDSADDCFEIASHRDCLISVPKARIDGTQSPTKIPASLSAKNHK